MIAVEWVVVRLLAHAGRGYQEYADVLSGQDELRGAVDLLHMEGSVVKDDRDRFDGLLDLEELDVSKTSWFIVPICSRSIDIDDGAEAIVEQASEKPLYPYSSLARMSRTIL